jgi:anti-sigma regulatory factor (Ser/Thr protein kinase)
MTDELVTRALAGAERRDDTLALLVRRTGAPAEPAPLPGHSMRWQVAAEVQGAQHLRRDAVRWLRERGIAGGDAALVIAELLNNAVRAARSTIVLELAVSASRVDVAVTDDGPGLMELPDEVAPSPDAESSRGLFLVRKLSRDVALDPNSVGTTVRCWLPVGVGEVVVVPGQVPGQVQRNPAG